MLCAMIKHCNHLGSWTRGFRPERLIWELHTHTMARYETAATTTGTGLLTSGKSAVIALGLAMFNPMNFSTTLRAPASITDAIVAERDEELANPNTPSPLVELFPPICQPTTFLESSSSATLDQTSSPPIVINLVCERASDSQGVV